MPEQDQITNLWRVELEHAAETWYSEEINTEGSEIERERFATFVGDIFMSLTEREFSRLWSMYYRQQRTP